MRNTDTKTGSKKKYAGKVLCMAMCLGLALSATGCIKKPADAGTGQAGTQETQTAYRNDVSTQELKDKVAAGLGDNYWPSMSLGEEELEGMVGLTADLYEEATAEMPMISTHVDTLIIVQAEDGKAAEVEAALNAYRDTKVNDTMQYPMNLGKIQASMVKTFGNYVCFVQLGADVTEALDQGDEAVIKHCQEANEEALGIIEDALKEA